MRAILIAVVLGLIASHCLADEQPISIGATVIPLKDAIKVMAENPELKFALPRARSTGVIVTKVDADGAFAKSGIKPGDIITKIGTTVIKDNESFKQWAATTTPGKKYPISATRADASGKWHSGTILLTAVPPSAKRKVLGKFGDLEVTLLDYGVDKIPLKNLGRQSKSKDDLLFVRLRISNKSESKKADYRAWNAEFPHLDSASSAVATDNLGNVLKRCDFGFGTEVPGAIKRTESIYPGKSVEDVLVFERPVDGATAVKVELPMENIEAKGKPVVAELQLR